DRLARAARLLTGGPRRLGPVRYLWGVAPPGPMEAPPAYRPAPVSCPRCAAALVSERLMDLRLSVLMPVYNERATLREALARVEAVPIPKEIVLVDDGSTDGTRDLLREIEAGAGGRAPFDNRLAVHY